MEQPFPRYREFCAVEDDHEYHFAINNKVDLTDAYTWDGPKIIVEIKKIAANTNNEYGVRTAGNAAALIELEPIISALCKLDSPLGAEFRTPDPKQHVRRRVVGADQVLNPATMHIGVGNGETRLPAHDRDFTIFADILGLFLSIAADPVPVGASRENYCFPLLAVYAKWLTVLCHANLAVFPPMVQISWYMTPDKKMADVFLGCATGGQPETKKIRPGWQDTLREWRYNIIAHQNERFALDGWNWQESVQRTVRDAALRNEYQANATAIGSLFGNCAETYPYTSSLKNLGGAEKALRCWGMAMVPKMTKSVTALSARKLALYNTLRNPCSNCRYLIDIWQGERENFNLHPVDQDGEPDQTAPQYFPLVEIAA